MVLPLKDTAMMITKIHIIEAGVDPMYGTWEYAPGNEDHAYHICQVIRGLGYRVELTQRPPVECDAPGCF